MSPGNLGKIKHMVTADLTGVNVIVKGDIAVLELQLVLVWGEHGLRLWLILVWLGFMLTEVKLAAHIIIKIGLVREFLAIIWLHVCVVEVRESDLIVGLVSDHLVAFLRHCLKVLLVLTALVVLPSLK